MRGKFIAASGTAALLLLAATIDAKPINNLEGCAYTTYLSPGATYAQSFKPTFSVLRRVSFALFEAYEPYGDVTYRVILRDQSGVQVASSEDGVLLGSTSQDDAASGDAVNFTFPGGARVTPGQAYILEFARISGGSDAWACTSFNSYADGTLFYNGAPNMDWDFVFAAWGGGPPK
jgi:hypothetical protein